MKLPSDADAILSPSVSIQLAAHACYRALMAVPRDGADPDFGGTLLYVGELDADGRAMTVAGNVAGCATLAVTADVTAQKLAIRDAVIDFVVTSLDEALRILKNEIRKRNCVGVCVGGDRDLLEQEMMHRGVLPDFVLAGSLDHQRQKSRFGEQAREVTLSRPEQNVAVIAWRISQAPARWMPRLDTIAIDCLEGDVSAQRWVRLSPRYFGRSNSAERAFYCESRIAFNIAERIESSISRGVIASEVSISVINGQQTNSAHVSPPPAD